MNDANSTPMADPTNNQISTLTAEKEQNLWDALTHVNAVLDRTNDIYGHTDVDSEEFAETLRKAREGIVEAGEIVMEADTGAPDQCSEAYVEFSSGLARVDDHLEMTWGELNNAVQALDQQENAVDWGTTTGTDAAIDAVRTARDEMWKAQAELETLLADFFDATNEDFASPASSVEW